MKRRRHRGFTMFELVVASGLVLMVLTGAGMVVANTERISITTRTKDTATAFAVSILERTAVFGCGLQPRPGLDASALSDRCAVVYSAQGVSLPGGFATDVANLELTSAAANNRVFNVSYTTRWRVLPDASIPSLNSNACAPVNPSTNRTLTPSLLERTVTLRYRVLGQESAPDPITALTATPDQYIDAARASLDTADLVVYAPKGTLVSVSDPAAMTTSSAITRTAVECVNDTGALVSAAWFPFLKPGTQYLVTGGSINNQVSTGAAGTLTKVGA